MSGPRVEGVDDDVPTDRASATIGGAVVTREEPGRRSTTPVHGPFDKLATWLAQVITHPVDVNRGRAASADLERELGAARLEDLVTPSRRLSAADRLAIYHHGYKARLIECVADDYRVLARAIPAFERIASGYVDMHPSSSWSLLPYARHLPTFLEGVDLEWLTPLGLGPARDLARLEWAMVEVSHAPLPPPLDLSRLGALDPSLWPALSLVPSAALRVLALDRPLLVLYSAIAHDEPWTLPEPAWSSVATWRQNGRVWRMSLTPTTHALVTSLMRSVPLGEALAAVPADAEEDVMRWFSEWVSCGFFAEIWFPEGG